MAIDTTAKKLSVYCHGSPWQRTLPPPSGDLDQGDKQHFLHLYSGILAQPPATIVGATRLQFTAPPVDLQFTAPPVDLTFTAPRLGG